jgi:CHAD domain-containing protein
MYNTAPMPQEIQLAEVEFPPLLDLPADPEWSLGASAQHAVLRYFRELLAQRQVVLDNADIEGVHEIRVAARRCRTALQTFRALWREADARRFEDYLEKFATTFGVARDLDVMLLYLHEQIEQAQGERAAALNWLLERNTQRRLDEQPRLGKVLRRMERDSFHLAFVAYFSKLPVDLWVLGEVHGQG